MDLPSSVVDDGQDEKAQYPLVYRGVTLIAIIQKLKFYKLPKKSMTSQALNYDKMTKYSVHWFKG